MLKYWNEEEDNVHFLLRSEEESPPFLVVNGDVREGDHLNGPTVNGQVHPVDNVQRHLAVLNNRSMRQGQVNSVQQNGPFQNGLQHNGIQDDLFELDMDEVPRNQGNSFVISDKFDRER